MPNRTLTAIESLELRLALDDGLPHEDRINLQAELTNLQLHLRVEVIFLVPADSLTCRGL